MFFLQLQLPAWRSQPRTLRRWGPPHCFRDIWTRQPSRHRLYLAFIPVRWQSLQFHRREPQSDACSIDRQHSSGRFSRHSDCCLPSRRLPGMCPPLIPGQERDWFPSITSWPRKYNRIIIHAKAKGPVIETSSATLKTHLCFPRHILQTKLLSRSKP
jgi:hypothetical protein